MNKKELEKVLRQFDKATDNLAEVFISKYFGEDVSDVFWVGSQDSDREVLSVNDYFFNLERVVDALRYNASSKKLFEYYDMVVEAGHKDKVPEINFKNYIQHSKLKKVKKK